MARTIHDQLHEPQMEALIADLREQGLRFEQEGPPPGEGPLAGKTLVLTGTLPELTREQATETDPGRGRPGDRLGARARPTTSSPARARAPSSRRPSGWGSPVLDEAGLLALLG